MSLRLTRRQQALLEALLDTCFESAPATLDDHLVAVAGAHALLLAARGDDEMDAVRRATDAGKALTTNTFNAWHALLDGSGASDALTGDPQPGARVQ